MKIKVSEATGIQLDWLVAKCEGVNYCTVESNGFYFSRTTLDYSTDWAQGGPIIEREGISVETWNDKYPELTWAASIDTVVDHDGDTFRNLEHGCTPLIAAMRCYVASKLGDEVEIPEELSTP